MQNKKKPTAGAKLTAATTSDKSKSLKHNCLEEYNKLLRRLYSACTFVGELYYIRNVYICSVLNHNKIHLSWHGTVKVAKKGINIMTLSPRILLHSLCISQGGAADGWKKWAGKKFKRNNNVPGKHLKYIYYLYY